jgi:hypothetical protein
LLECPSLQFFNCALYPLISCLTEQDVAEFKKKLLSKQQETTARAKKIQ